MAIRPTFYGFEMARSALAASQRSIDVTGQNIANINTDGYSRQRVNLSAVGAGGLEWKYPISPAENVGLGVNIDSVKRIRDEFLDIRFRSEQSHNGRYALKGETMSSIENLTDEFVTDNVYAILTDFMNALQNFQMNSDEAEFASMMRSASLKLTTTLNKISFDMNDVVTMQFQQMDLAKNHINAIAKSLNDVNKELRVQHLLNPLAISNELLDKRDLLLDQLAQFGEITVIHDTSGGPNGGEPTGGVWVYFGDVDTSDMDPSDPDVMGAHDGLLVWGNESGYSQLDFNIDEARERYNNNFADGFVNGEPIRFTWADSIEIDDPAFMPKSGESFTSSTGEIFGYYEMVNGFGYVSASEDELDLSSKGIPYYMEIINTFAVKFADTFNSLNENSGDLFVSNDSGETLNMFNITISQEWQDEEQYIVRTLFSDDDITPGASRNDNILKMIDALRREDTVFELGGGSFTGSFQQFIGMLNSEVALEIDYNNKKLTMSDILLLNVDNMRESIKGVSEDEEAMNLSKFQKSYNAAARYMTTLDEMLDLVVNRLGVVGR